MVYNIRDRQSTNSAPPVIDATPPRVTVNPPASMVGQRTSSDGLGQHP
jgi:hypothetical protein